MSCKVKLNRHRFLALRLYWNSIESWEGTGLPDTPENRKISKQKLCSSLKKSRQELSIICSGFLRETRRIYFKKLLRPSQKTVGDYYSEWIKRKVPPVVRPGLSRDYQDHFSRYILAKFAHVSLVDVTSRLLEEFRSFLLNGRGRSLKSARNIIDATFRAMIRDARKIDYLIDKDPFEALQWPRPKPKRPDPFALGQFLESLQKNVPRNYSLLHRLDSIQIA